MVFLQGLNRVLEDGFLGAGTQRGEQFGEAARALSLDLKQAGGGIEMKWFRRHA
jgi:hypothetical protein